MPWREYGAEAAAIGLFMISAMVCTVLLEHPAAALRAAVPDPIVRRVLMGAAMGLTAIALIYSPLGARSGAHMNPAVTLAYWRLGRMRRRDAVAYIASQCAGAVAGTWLAAGALGEAVAHPGVNYVLTQPGTYGLAGAVAGEFAISFLTLSIVLAVSSRPTLMPATGLVAGAVVMINIVVEAPLSGMSMNPARSFGPALVAGDFSAFWIYLLVPPLGMQLAAAMHYALATGGCAKLHHPSTVRCLFCGA